MRKAPRDGLLVEKTGVSSQHGGSSKPTGSKGDVRELHADDRPHQLEYNPVHELHGGEDRRGYVVRN